MKKRTKNNETTRQKNSYKTAKGITLISLVITIIILLILAVVSIGTLTGENGLIARAQKAKNNTLDAQNLENTTLANLENLIGSSTGSIAGDIFDETGNEDGKLHVGDFVNYTSGTWTEADMNKIAESGAKIAANNSTTNKPTKPYEFGGFEQGTSKDGNATSFNTDYAYVKDETGKAVTGWRVFDIEEDGTVTLITAGCPEDYYHPSGNYAYQSEYILTGNKSDSSIDYSAYTPRDWTIYQNSTYRATNAKALTKERLDSWYTKYVTAGTAADTYTDAIFQKINGTKYESLIDNYSYYWLSSAYNSYSVCVVSPYSRLAISGDNDAYGVRILVSLPADIKWTQNGTKTVNSRNVNYNYNVWNIQ